MDTNPMWKLDYLTRTLAHRSRRKDIENYAVLGIWNRVKDLNLKPVAQQPVRTGDGHIRFIDLYFPQVGIGIEIDEPYHSTDAQIANDDVRARSIQDIVRSQDLSTLQDGLRRVSYLDVKDSEEFENRLDEVAEKIRNESSRRHDWNTWRDWTEVRPNPVEYLKSADWLDANEMGRDDVGFSRIADIHHAIFSRPLTSKGNGTHRSHDPLSRYNAAYDSCTWEGVRLPIELSIANLYPEGMLGGRTWRNELSDDGETLLEVNAGMEPGPASTFRAWFVRDKRNLGIPSDNLYRFAGVFRGEVEDAGVCQWRRIGTRLRILRPGDAFDHTAQSLIEA